MSASLTISAADLLFILAFIFVVARCYSRFVLVKSFGIDDVCVVMGFLSSVALIVCLIIARQYVPDEKDRQPNEFELAGLIKSIWGVFICFCLGTTLTHNSAILQCLRFIVLDRMRIFCWFFVAFVSVFGFVSIVLIIFNCTPIYAFWQLNTPGAKCINPQAWWYLASGIVILIDIIVVAIPIITVRSANLPRRQKTLLLIVFAVGGLRSVATIFRVYYQATASAKHDITKSSAATAETASIELNLGIICVCVPTLKPFVLKFVPWLLGSDTVSNNASVTTDSELSGEKLVPENRPGENKGMSA